MTIISSTPLRLVCLAAIIGTGIQAADSDTDYRWRILPNLGGGGSVNLTLTRHLDQGFTSSTNTVPLSSLHGLEPGDLWGGNVSFHIRRDAGTLYCKGAFVMGVGSGSVRFEADPHFVSELKAIGISFNEEQLPELVFEDVRLSTVRDLRASCACVRSIDDVLQLSHHGVDGHYLRQVTQLSSSPLDIEEVTAMKDHGLQTSLLEALKYGGYHMPARAAIELQDHGVDASFIREMAPQFKGDRTSDNLIKLHDHGVTAEFARSLREAGVTPSPDEIIQLHDHGVDAKMVRGVKDAGFDPSSATVIKLQDHGVSVEFMRSLREAGVTPSTDEIIELHDHGIDPKLIRATKDAGLELSPGAIIQLHDHGVEPPYVRSIEAALHSKLSVNALIALHDHGVSAEFAQKISDSGFAVRDEGQLIHLHDHGVPVELVAEVGRSHRSGWTADDLAQLHDHGVDANFLRSFDAVGYSQASVSELIELHDHGVTADYAHHLQSEGFGVLPVSKLIQMKDHGV